MDELQLQPLAGRGAYNFIHQLW